MIVFCKPLTCSSKDNSRIKLNLMSAKHIQIFFFYTAKTSLFRPFNLVKFIPLVITFFGCRQVRHKFSCTEDFILCMLAGLLQLFPSWEFYTITISNWTNTSWQPFHSSIYSSRPTILAALISVWFHSLSVQKYRAA